jgi:hypothetical protein
MAQVVFTMPACPGCCSKCPPHTPLSCVTAGIVSCGKFTVLGFPTRCFVVTITSGVNGAFDLAWVEANFDWENATVGVVSVQEVDCDTDTPIGDPASADVIAIVSCDPDTGSLVENMGFGNPLDAGSPVGVFQNSGALIDTPASNNFVCTAFPSTTPAVGGGTFTALS